MLLRSESLPSGSTPCGTLCARWLLAFAESCMHWHVPSEHIAWMHHHALELQSWKSGCLHAWMMIWSRRG
ncbi:hypothetical protein DUNSADRAFT_5414 [Dunaliella salina]|uniref:Uncharacterized protein n=1 Tax=Dunaliella salina TaxID=3046 RepID=A0ABQ7GQA9_DUNSA|nr:hypothetical protein DUNSADRAFT_5414 [Dunaliella salina]|eukprot:KAF5836787.1 hypothetical protein DUNSADRAFT_5414 [Dunaliella salina]